MAFRSFPSLPRVTLEWEILGSAMLIGFPYRSRNLCDLEQSTPLL